MDERSTISRTTLFTRTCVASCVTIATAFAASPAAADSKPASRPSVSELTSELAETRRHLADLSRAYAKTLDSLQRIEAKTTDAHIRRVASSGVHTATKLAERQRLPRLVTSLIPDSAYRSLQMWFMSRVGGDRMPALRRAAAQYRFFSHQARELLRLMPGSHRQKLQGAQLLYPRVVDLVDWPPIYSQVLHRKRLQEWVRANQHKRGRQLNFVDGRFISQPTATAHK